MANEPYRESVSNPNYEQTPDTAIVSVDNATGAIRTMLSGRNYLQDQVNLADARRQPGSSFKPFTLVAGVPRGDPAGLGLLDEVTAVPPRVDGNDCSCVSNAEGAGDAGYESLWGATQDSDQRRVRAADPGGRAGARWSRPPTTWGSSLSSPRSRR